MLGDEIEKCVGSKKYGMTKKRSSEIFGR